MNYIYTGTSLGPKKTVTQAEYDVLSLELKKEYTEVLTAGHAGYSVSDFEDEEEEDDDFCKFDPDDEIDYEDEDEGDYEE